MKKDQKSKSLGRARELGIKNSIKSGDLVRHQTVPELGLGVVAYESRDHSGFWIVVWCDERYKDVGNKGIHESFLVCVN